MESKDSIVQMPPSRSPPNIKEFLMKKYWTIQEAAFVLQGWPQLHLAKFGIDESSLKGNQYDQYIKLDRSYFYSTFEDLYKKHMKTNVIHELNHLSATNDIKNDVDKGLLHCETLTVPHHSILYFILSFDIIQWALLKGYTLPKNLQEAIGIFQNISSQRNVLKASSSLILKVRKKIAAQFFLLKDPNQEREKLCRKVLRYFCENENTDLTAVRKNLNELYDTPGKKGRRNKTVAFADSYIMRAIPEILTKDSEGKHCYNFLLLKEAVHEAAVLKCISISKMQIPDITEEFFGEDFKKHLGEFMNDPVVNLYMNTNEYVKAIFLKIFSNTYSNYVTWFQIKDSLKVYNEKADRSMSLLVFFNRNFTELN